MLRINSHISTAYVEADALINLIGEKVKIHGMIYKVREMSEFAFVILRTKNSLLQCVYSREYSLFPLSDLTDNVSVVIEGSVVRDDRSKTGFEVQLINCKVLSYPISDTPVVINNKDINASIDTLLDYRPITLRNARERAIFKLQAGICAGFRQFFHRNNFTEIHSPKIVSMGAEGGANIFDLDYFGKNAFLTQSPQFYKQIMVGVFERVYEIAPVFRAEKHDTSRHINEYTSVDFEVGFIESFYELMQLETMLIIDTLAFLKEYYQDELSLLNVIIPDIEDIPAIKFMEAKELVSKTYNRRLSDKDDFEPEEEKLLSEIIKKQTGSEFVFVTHYKASKRPFYTQESIDDPGFTDSFDLLFRGMEITTGGQRIHDYNEQIVKMQARGMNVESFSSYLMAHKYGLPPHGGLGIGLERFTAKLLGFQNIRYATLFPRDTSRLEP